MGGAVVLGVFMRWLHITSVVTLIGGFLYARFALWPVFESLEPAQAEALAKNTAVSVRPLLYTALVCNLVSGLYNYLTKASYPPLYHMLIGIKFLFVLHIYAVAILYASPNASAGKRRRWLTGLAISGLVIIAISADLRWLSLSALAPRP